MRIAATGFVSSVGESARASCAAIRGGVSRPRAVERVTLWNAEEEETEPLVGHPIAGLTDGFQGAGRLVRMAQAALQDLERELVAAESRSIGAASGLVLCTRAADGALAASLGDVPGRLAREVAPGGSIPDGEWLSGSLSPILGLDLVRRRLEAGTWHGAILLAVDSLVDPEVLGTLLQAGRLKGPEHPSGLAPGEAAVALYLDGRREPSVARVAAMGASAAPAEPTPAAQLGLHLGRALAEAAAGAAEGSIGDVLGSLNGEAAPALAWGVAQARLPRPRFSSRVGETWPATSIGDTGVASCMASLCVAGHFFARGCARASSALVWALGEDGAAGAVLLRAAGAGRGP